jgi:spore germination protein KC
MKKVIPAILLLIILLFVFTGCDSLSGIDKYYFIISLGIDKANNDLLKISIQVSSTSSQDSSGSSGSSQSSNYKIYTVESTTVDEGFEILNNYLDKKINLSHCSALIISEDLAKDGISTIFNSLSNNTELRNTCNLIISSSSAYDVLDKVANSGETFSSRLFDYLTTSTEYTGFTTKSTIGTFFKEFQNTNCHPTAIYVTVSNDTVQTSGIAVFKDEYMVGHIDELESIAHSIVTKKLNTCSLTIDDPFEDDEKIDLDISLYKTTDIDIEVLNSSPFISITAYPEGIIKNSGTTFDYTDEENVKIVEEATNSYITKILKNYLYDITKNYNTDIVGFEGMYKSKFKTEEEFEKINWNEIFQDSFYNISVKTKINSSNLFNKE